MQYPHCIYRFILAAISFAMALFPIQAQSLSDARSSFNHGEYEKSVKFYNALIEDYKDNSWPTTTLEHEKEKALSCLRLLREADASRNNKRYSSAIEQYRQIATLNPLDSNVKTRIKDCEKLQSEYSVKQSMENDWKKCRTIADYERFAQLYPHSKYEDIIQQKIEEMKNTEDDEKWANVKSRNTIEFYEAYLTGKTPYSKHISEAQQKLFPLYISRAAEYYNNKNYSTAKKYYEKAQALFALPDLSSSKYKKCLEELEYERLANSSYRFMTDMEGFLKRYPASSHASIIRGWMVESEMSRGNFDAARIIVNKNATAFSDSFTPDTKWWMKHIKEREKVYKKNHKSSLTKSNKSAYNLNSRNKTTFPFQLSIPIVFDYHPKVRSIGGGLGIGGYGSPFHVDILGMYSSYPGEKGSFLIKAEPVYNIKRYKSDSPFRDFHISIGPSIGYSGLYGFTYGAKVGIGLHYTELSLLASNCKPLGWYIGVSFRVHLAHVTLH